MAVILHDLKSYPENYEYQYGEIEPLDEYSIEDLEKLGIDEAWYWYASGSYEGSGQILMRKGDLYDTHDMGHCSCYGPTENISFNGCTLAELESNLSSELSIYVKPLIDMAKKRTN